MNNFRHQSESHYGSEQYGEYTDNGDYREQEEEIKAFDYRDWVDESAFTPTASYNGNRNEGATAVYEEDFCDEVCERQRNQMIFDQV